MIIDNSGGRLPPELIAGENLFSLVTATNLGVSRSWNLMLRSLPEPDDLLLIVNDDNALHPGAVEAFRKLGTAHPAHHYFTTATGGFSCFCLRKRALDEVGEFDETFYPAYFEDNDYYYRMKLKNLDFIHTAFEVYEKGVAGEASHTLNSVETSPDDRETIRVGFQANERYYRAKWGGGVDHETHTIPFGQRVAKEFAPGPIAHDPPHPEPSFAKMSLVDLFLHFQCDKQTSHKYGAFYEMIFHPLRSRKDLKFLEIGTTGINGGSLRSFEKYFAGEVFGLDIAPPAGDGFFDRVFQIQADAYDLDNLHCLRDEFGGFDVILDDGPHTLESHHFLFQHYPNLLNRGGYLIAEDCAAFYSRDDLRALVQKFDLTCIDLTLNPNASDHDIIVIWHRP